VRNRQDVIKLHGKGYSRSFILSCPCWDHILLLTILRVKQKYLGAYYLPKYFEEESDSMEENN
jgi:hypothetical protein